jgi:hypothetical protein
MMDHQRASPHRVTMPRMSGKTILAALVVLFLLTPFIESMPNGDLVEAIAITVVLVAGVGATGGNPRAMAGAALLAIPAVIGRWLHYLAPGLVHPGVYLAVAVMAMVYITLRFVVYVMRAERVTSDVLCTGLSAFLMIALLWAFGYIMVDRLVPGSFLYTAWPGARDDRFRGPLLQPCDAVHRGVWGHRARVQRGTDARDVPGRGGGDIHRRHARATGFTV